jgi:copper chaperone CopZ
MAKTVLSVDGMSCDHCVRAITKAVGALPGVSHVAVDLNAKPSPWNMIPHSRLIKSKTRLRIKATISLFDSKRGTAYDCGSPSEFF